MSGRLTTVSRAFVVGGALTLCACAHRASSRAEVTRTELTVESEPGVHIAVREVALAEGMSGGAVVLVHGAGAGGVASFDNPVPGYSLAEDLARAGYATYVLDVRGWGRSSRPAALDGPRDASPAAVTSEEAVRDVAAAVELARARGHRTIAVLGWATGGHWAGMFAATHPDGLTHLIMLNALYGVDAPWSLRAGLEVEGSPGVLSPSLGAYTLRDEQSLLTTWNRNIPIDDKAAWRDPGVATAYVELTLGADPTSSSRQPRSARVPAGPLADSYALSKGIKLWEARDVRAQTMIVRGSLDFWSRPQDVAALKGELSDAGRVEVLELPDSTHFLFLDRPEHGRARFVEAVLAFLGSLR